MQKNNKKILVYQNSYNCQEESIKSIDDYIYWYDNCRFQVELKIWHLYNTCDKWLLRQLFIKLYTF